MKDKKSGQKLVIASLGKCAEKLVPTNKTKALRLVGGILCTCRVYTQNI